MSKPLVVDVKKSGPMAGPYFVTETGWIIRLPDLPESETGRILWQAKVSKLQAEAGRMVGLPKDQEKARLEALALKVWQTLAGQE